MKIYKFWNVMFYLKLKFLVLNTWLDSWVHIYKIIYLKFFLHTLIHLVCKGTNATWLNVSGSTERTDRQVRTIWYSHDSLFPIVGAPVTNMTANFTPSSITSHSTHITFHYSVGHGEFQSYYHCFKIKYSVLLSNSLRVKSGFVMFSCSSFKRFHHLLKFLQLKFSLPTRLFAFHFF